jgi:O-antigen/teichoic acid export membrane protein
MASAGVVTEQNSRKETDSHIVVRNTAVQTVRYLAVWGANIALVLFLPRYLGDQGLGQLQFALSFVSLFGFMVALGTRNYLIKEIARDTSRLPALLSTALGLRAVAGIAVVAVMVVAAEIMGQSGVALHVLYIMMAWMVVTSFWQLLAASLQGLEQMGWPSFTEVMNKVLVVAIGIPLLIFGGDVRTYAGVLLLAAVVNLLLNSGYIIRFARIKVDLHPKRMTKLVVAGSPYIAMGFLLAAYMHTDVVMLRMFTSESVVGWHAASLQIYRSLEFLPAVLMTALLPTLSRIHALGPEGAAPLARRALGAVAIIMLPLGVGLSLTSRELISFFPYPPEFGNSVPVLTVMAWAVPVTALLTILGTIAMAIDRQKIWAIAMAVTVGLNVAMNAVVIPWTQSAFDNGAIGAAATTLFTECLMIAFGIYLLRRIIFERGLMITLAKVGIAVSLMGFVVYDAKSYGVGLWALVAAGVVTYGVLALFLRVVNRDELMTIWKTVTTRSRPAQ